MAEATIDTVIERTAVDLRRDVRDTPLIAGRATRTIIGAGVAIAAAALAAIMDRASNAPAMIALIVAAWIPAVLLTDKYVHKYPQRYYTYLVASHFKAAIVMAVFLAVLVLIGSSVGVTWPALAKAFVVFVIADAVVSAPYRRNLSSERARAVAVTTTASAPIFTSVPVDTNAIVDAIAFDSDRALGAFVAANLPKNAGGVRAIASVDAITEAPNSTEQVGLLISRVRMNDVQPLDRFIATLVSRVVAGGYLATSYVPQDKGVARLRQRYPAILFRVAYLLYFVWCRAVPKLPFLHHVHRVVTNGKNRAMSKVEAWGRLAYAGMNVVAESDQGEFVYVLAQRIGPPSTKKRPSYYPVVALEKVGLDDSTFALHKIRSMFPYSEFLQKRIFEDHGLSSTGKFANDPRLTEYGPFLRRYWLDELPQVFDWLRGDVKLVGMRATSRHYLGLYPRELFDLYIQTKPGLIPPIFDESTPGFDKIVAVELAYLRSYWQNPVRTDLRYFWLTFSDIFLKGVRSK